jgi:hypothetical protein
LLSPLVRCPYGFSGVASSLGVLLGLFCSSDLGLADSVGWSGFSASGSADSVGLVDFSASGLADSVGAVDFLAAGLAVAALAVGLAVAVFLGFVFLVLEVLLPELLVLALAVGDGDTVAALAEGLALVLGVVVVVVQAVSALPRLKLSSKAVD